MVIKIRYNMFMNRLITLFALLFFTVYANNNKPCHLLPEFSDENSDLLADSPKDKSKYIDPYTLVFAYPPNESPMIYKSIWQDFVIYLEQVTGKKVVFFPYRTNNAEVEAMKAGILHIAGFNTGNVPLAVNKAGFVPKFVMANKDGNFGYRMQIITAKNSSFNSVTDIKNKTFTFTAPSSNSGYKLAIKTLKNRFHLIADKDYKVSYSGNHNSSIQGIISNKYLMASIASSVKDRMIKRGDIKEKDIKILYSSKVYPTTAYGYAYNLKPSLIDKINRAFITFDWTKTSLKKGFKSKDKFVKINYKRDWALIRENNYCNQKGLKYEKN